MKGLILSGSISGFLVLGVGGRLLMRALAHLTPEPPRFSPVGTLEVIGLGLAWGALTAPLLRLFEGDARRSPIVIGVAHGALVFVTALAGFLLVTGGVGQVEAPTSFIALGVVLFPLLFLVHGLAVVVIRRLHRSRLRRVARRGHVDMTPRRGHPRP